MQYDIQKVLVVSTAHLKREEADELTRKGLDVTQDRYGYQLYTNHTEEHEESEFSVEIRNLMALAREQDCNYLRFDSDGPTLENYPVFDW